jgi:hypothetical protein
MKNDCEDKRQQVLNYLRNEYVKRGCDFSVKSKKIGRILGCTPLSVTLILRDFETQGFMRKEGKPHALWRTQFGEPMQIQKKSIWERIFSKQ